MNEPSETATPTLGSLLKRCTTPFKMAGVTVLILLLLVPLGMVRSVLYERLGRRNEAVANITSTWGREQKIVGPVLVIPYRQMVKSWKEQPTGGGKIERVEVADLVTVHACFLPTNLAIVGEVKPLRLRRAIYEAVVYSGRLEFSGQFARPDFNSLRIEEKDVLWDEAVVTFAIPDLRGVKESLSLKWGAASHPMLPGCKLKGFPSGMHASVGSLRASDAAIPFQLDLPFNGSGGLSFAPVGSQNTVKLKSPWPDPSFFGSFLPAERQVSRDGFEATWQVSYYGRDYAQQWTDREASAGLNPASADSSLFGVYFLSGIDAYRNAERAMKYGVLVIVLVFAVYFLFEILSALKIHPFQYAVVGAALCLFYLGLLSLSEFIAFGKAYLAAAAVTTLLICVHSAKMLKSGARTFIIGALLAGTYGFLYVTLQLQDYALLLGTAGLFAVLAAVIWITRNIDWYARDRA